MTNQTPQHYTFDQFKQAADAIQSQTDHRPKIALVLGSGLSPLAEEVTNADIIPYQDIPHFPHSGAPGHAGRLVIGKLGDKTALVMQGRTHFYEGYSAQRITFPIRVMNVLGIKTLILTNAAGGVNRQFQSGDLMLITDHLNFVGMAGFHPLRGPNMSEFGPRFPSMTEPYSPELIDLTRNVARQNNLILREGVYAYLAGPSFETPAEIRMLAALGADAVGMSTVPEAIVAKHSGMRVLGISSVTNVAVAAFGSGLETTHEEVLETGKTIVPRLILLLKGILEKLP